MFEINPYIDLPMGFGMALIQNTQALKYFENLSESQKQEIINNTNYISSKQQMEGFVDSLGKNTN